MVFGVRIRGRFVTYVIRINIKTVVSTGLGIFKIISCLLYSRKESRIIEIENRLRVYKI